MKRILFVAVICWLLAGSQGYGSEKKLPVIDGKVTVATVNGDPITSEEFNRLIAQAHAGRSENEKASPINYSAIMNRIINTRLIVIEGRNMGLDKLPDIKNRLNDYSRETLMKLLLAQSVKDTKPDEREVDKLYKESVKEWKISSVRFEKEDEAKKFKEEMGTGNAFEKTVKKALAQGIAKEVDWGNYLKNRDLIDPIALLVSKMTVGSVSPVVELGKKDFIIFKLEAVRFPKEEDSEAREMAQVEARKRKRVQAAKNYYEDLKKKYVKMNEKLFEALDYESAEPGLEKLLEDKRVIVEIEGAEPITVGEFSKALKQRFYHGIDKAIEAKRVNEMKYTELENILQERILVNEALKHNLDKTEEYKYTINEFENSLIFGTFVNKVIVPDIKINLEELKTYYEENREKYKFPEMMRLKSLVFQKKSDAVNALDKLTGGTDFDWLRANAEGQVDNDATRGVLPLEGRLLSLKSLPEDLRKVLSGANPGDFRLFGGPGNFFYVLYIYDVTPAKQQPFDKVREEVAKKVFGDKVEKAVEDYANQLREYYPVEIYAKDLQ